MFKLKKGTNKVQLSLTPSFTPLLEFTTPYTGKINLSKRHADNAQRKDANIKANNDEVLDLSSYREYFTAYRDNYTQLVITVSAKATLTYEPFADAPVESTVGKTIDFGLEEDPDYNPPEPDVQKCPICQQEVPMSNLMSHIQANHM